MHGLALNVEPDLIYFDLIDPCGLGRPVTSLHRLLHHKAPSIEAVKAVLIASLRRAFAGEAQPAARPPLPAGEVEGNTPPACPRRLR